MSQKIKSAIGLYLEGIRDGNPREALEKYTGARYTQHSTGVKDGKEGFIEFFDEFIKRNPKRDIQILRTIEDGNHVFVHAYQNINDGESQWVTGDFFDTDENDKLIEHWDVISSYSDTTPSGHTTTDGSTEITDLEKTEENKQLVKKLIHDVLMNQNPSNIDKYISAKKYTQHNKNILDGLEYFKNLLLSENNPLLYQEIVLLVGQGNFVATLCKTTWKSIPQAQVDIFRIENGLIVEHWDVLEPVPSPEIAKNSGKF